MDIGLGRGVLTDSVSELFVAPGGGYSSLLGFLLHNTDSGVQYVTFHVIDSTETGQVGKPELANILFRKELQPQESYTFAIPAVALLAGNDSIWGGSTSNNAVNYLLIGSFPNALFS